MVGDAGLGWRGSLAGRVRQLGIPVSERDHVTWERRVDQPGRIAQQFRACG